ncbi:Protein O-mannosyl-transferase tmtc3 [Polyplax serrata]|uniref:Protein O-mannosyl-transferase tmtc3 n=1 Tax=Polyplax serrata TaxID=468196 RepID=A0AAN8S2D1_POLSC
MLLIKTSFSCRRIAWLGVSALILFHGCKTYNRNWDWESEYSIFTSGLKVNQRNAKLFNNVGHALESQGKFREALSYFNKAVSVQRDDIGAHINVGRTYNHLKMFKEAEEAYLRAKSLLPKAKPGESYQARIAPNHLNVFLNLANLIAKNETRLEEADLLYRQAISMRADYTQAYINRGDILLKLNRTKEAQEVYERALFYDSNNPDIYYNLGVVFLEQGKASQALVYLAKALEFGPDHEQALLNSAILLQELGRVELRKIAKEGLLKLLQKDASNERVYFNLGMLAMDDHDIHGAERWFRLAVQLKDDFRSALFNLALLLADDHRPLEAAPFLNQLVRYHPDHIKGLILLGDIYINNIKDLDAAENCYRRILQLDPENVQGLHNLCVVHVERGNLEKAEICLRKAFKLAPKEEYITRHLKIVQQRLAKLETSTKSVTVVEDAFKQPEEPNSTPHEKSKYFEENQIINENGGQKETEYLNKEKTISSSKKIPGMQNTESIERSATLHGINGEVNNKMRHPYYSDETGKVTDGPSKAMSSNQKNHGEGVEGEQTLLPRSADEESLS